MAGEPGKRAVAAFEWMELQALTGDIAAARSRLAEARSDKDNRAVRRLEQEITDAEARRVRLLAALTDELVGAPQAAAPPREGTAPALDAAIGYAPSEPEMGSISSEKGDDIVWEQLTPGDLERAEREIAKRREEMLARHAEELKMLDADRDQLAGLEQAVSEFLKKFGPSGGTAEVVELNDERESRAAARL